MRTRTKLLIAAIAATALLGMAVSGASARSLEIRNSANGFSIAWSPLRFAAVGREGACPVTLEGTYAAATIAKRAGTSMGRITGANVGTCTRNTATFLRETLPWEVQYQSFTGTLPTITTVSLNLIRMSFKENLEGIECLAATRVEQPAGGIATIEANGAITGFRADETRGIETSGGFFCSLGGRATFAGEARTITSRTGSEAITVRLIPPDLSPSPVSFGAVEPSSTTERTVAIQAEAEFTVNRINLTTGTSYSISDPNSCRGRRVAARGSCSFVVTFRAPAELARSAADTINVETSAVNMTDSVSGSTPPLIAEPSPIEFGRLATNTLAKREVTITSGVETTIESIRPRTGARFAITDPNRCVGTRLAVNGRCTFNVIVETPAESERTLEDRIVIATSAATIEDAVRAST